MDKVTGLGGVFLKVQDPKAMAEWYKKHLDIHLAGNDNTQYVEFKWINHNNPAVPGSSVFSLFKSDSTYFQPSASPFMINFRVKDLIALVETLKNDGVQLAGEPQIHEYGKFAWIIDPEGNKIELWEPVD